MKPIDNQVSNRDDPSRPARPGAFPRELHPTEMDPRDFARFPLGLLALVAAAGVIVVQARPSPFLAWLMLALLYVMVEGMLAERGRPFGGAGWPALVAMVPVIAPTGVILGATLAALAAGVVHRACHGDRFAVSGRFLAHVPAVTAGAAVVGLAASEGGWVAAVAGLGAGAVVHLQRWVLPRTTGLPLPPSVRHLPAGWELAEMAALGATAAVLGGILHASGWVATPLVGAGLLVVAAADQLRVGVARAREQTVDSLLLAVEAKDLYTRGHCQRVAAVAVELGGAMGLTGTGLHRLETAALLHDFGKVVVDRRLLRKRGRLTADEYRHVQEHAAVVAGLLDGIAFLRPVAPIIVEHHTHFDGSAYGGGRSDGRQSLEARILAVADAYDAMTTHRPYRRALTQAYAFDQLRRCGGSQFDPVVVEALIELLTTTGTAVEACGVGSDDEARWLAEQEIRHG